MDFSLQKPDDDSDITFYFPVPHLDVDESTLAQIKKDFAEEGFRTRVLGVDRYAVAQCWVEVAVSAGSFLAACTAKHYFNKMLNRADRIAQKPVHRLVDRLFDALDKSVRPKYDQICLSLRIGNRGREIIVPRRNKELAHEAIRNGFFEIWNKLDRTCGKIYWLDGASYPDDGPISLKVTHWNSESQGESLARIPLGSEEHAFWMWLIRTKRIREPITDINLIEFQTEFNKSRASSHS